MGSGRIALQKAALLGLLGVGALATCSGEPGAPEPTSSGAQGAQTSTPEVALEGTELVTSRTYLFEDLLPGALDVEIIPPVEGIYSYSFESFIYLGADAAGTRDVLSLFGADVVSVPSDPYRNDFQESTTVRDGVAPPPGKLPETLAALPFFALTEPLHDTTVLGYPGSAFDVEVTQMPAQATSCSPGGAACAEVLLTPDFAQYVEVGQQLRFTQLELPAGRVMIVQNLLDERAQPLLDALRFVHQDSP